MPKDIFQTQCSKRKKSRSSAYEGREEMEQLAMKKHEEKKQKRTKMNSGYGHCKTMGRNIGERYNQNKWDRRIMTTVKNAKTPKKATAKTEE